MLDQITATVIAKAQKDSADEGFTIDDAARIIVDKASLSASLTGIPVDAFDLAVKVAHLLRLPPNQAIGLAKAAMRLA